MSDPKYTIEFQPSDQQDSEAWPLSTLQTLGPGSANLFVKPNNSGGAKVLPAAHAGAPGVQPLSASAFVNTFATVSPAQIANAAKGLGPGSAHLFFRVSLVPVGV
jgi:hypothetical protein